VVTPTTAAGLWPARLCYTAAGIFSLASGGTNLIYGWNKGTDLPSSLVWAAVSLGVSIVFASSWPAFIRSIDAKHWSRAVMVLVALLITGAYSVSAAVGSAMGGRTGAAIEAKDAENRKAKAQATWDAAKAELDALTTAKPASDLQALIDNAKADLAKLPASRPIAEIEALIRGAAMHPNRGGGCTAVNGSLRMSCPKLEAEKARAAQRDRMTANIMVWTTEIARADQRRAELREKAKAAMDKAADELAKVGPAKVANSDAVALAGYLQGLGLNIDADRANKLLVLLAVLVIECGGGLALAVGMALGDSARHAPETQKRDGVPTATLGVSLGVPSACHQAFPAFQSRTVQQQHAQTEPLDQRLLRLIVERGGTLTAGQREIGRLIGVSASHAHRLLHDLFGAGVISLAPGRTGTVVKRIVNLSPPTCGNSIAS
jgi:hypothetical protein